MYWNAKWSCQIWRLKTFPGAKLSSLSRFQRRWHHQQLPGSRTPPQAFWKVSQHYHQDYRLVYFFVTKLSPLRIELLAQTAKFGLRLGDIIDYKRTPGQISLQQTFLCVKALFDWSTTQCKFSSKLYHVYRYCSPKNIKLLFVCLVIPF